MIKKVNKNKKRQKRHMRLRNKIQGTPERPRLNVFRSSKNIYAQVIDDSQGFTIASASSNDKEIIEKINGLNKTEAAKIVGQEVAKKAMDKGIETVIFDRGGYLYHGRVKSLADGARESGLKF
ncbi:LSU ribosomal protein L18P [Dethiosulfatibacter aminovorans DSM 17477]|uniref:Large ribosomal subunit protein uL18 n=1 Tax=Dethiosulfatibacter aminovorans DSM 17477 TaxID=1121476 RepID=A0A1M6L5R6_9FIRM|nr:50S ribosomal protein L18 [Dethiosulfatibacter aminovorans]SHJ66578.1 LSU ribosomal protein L18P [Dethiosulfatibacter aminovorans DSM 17477]